MLNLYDLTYKYKLKNRHPHPESKKLEWEWESYCLLHVDVWADRLDPYERNLKTSKHYNRTKKRAEDAALREMYHLLKDLIEKVKTKPHDRDSLIRTIHWYILDEEECVIMNNTPNEWDISEIKDMSYVFSGEIVYLAHIYGKRYLDNTKFNGDISRWDVSGVDNMHGMFHGSEFNGDISKWDVSSVKSMEHMFNKSEFNGDISRWDVSNVERMHRLFYESRFNGDISLWNVDKVVNGKEEILKRIEKCKSEKVRVIQDWWIEILLNPHHPVGKKYLSRKAEEVCSY